MTNQDNGYRNESQQTRLNSEVNARRHINGKVRILATIAGILLIIILAGIVAAKYINKDTPKSMGNKPNEVPYAETITPNAYGNFLSVAVKGFYQGGNTNNVEIPAHNYYPSAADIKNRDWTKQNMQLDDRMSDLIKSGEVVYETKGCKSDQPSNEQNKCTSFVVKSAGVVLFDSTKKD